PSYRRRPVSRAAGAEARAPRIAPGSRPAPGRRGGGATRSVRVLRALEQRFQRWRIKDGIGPGIELLDAGGLQAGFGFGRQRAEAAGEQATELSDAALLLALLAA